MLICNLNQRKGRNMELIEQLDQLAYAAAADAMRFPRMLTGSKDEAHTNYMEALMRRVVNEAAEMALSNALNPKADAVTAFGMRE